MALGAVILALGAALATAADQRSLVEIYRIAPGQHAGFLEFIALCDQANKEAGLPPRQLYVHQDGSSWDFVIIQPASISEEHSDTFATGPTTAAEWLKKLN